MTPSPIFRPQGTVYGTLLNSRAELAALGEQMHQPPYKGPPKAPVLYIKTANTWSANGSGIPLPAGVPQVDIGASVAMVIGPPRFDRPGIRTSPSVAGFLLVNDLSIPHASFFRPPVRFKCLDGFLGLGPWCVPPADAGNPDTLLIEVLINGELRHTVDLADAVRDAATLLRDVGDFMRLCPGDLLMLGCAPGRPQARAGDHIDIRARGRSAFGTLSNTLVAQTPPEAP